ncbi:MAG: hypothetical protein IJC46_04710 [Clostridia bacterium]|nr:hypothetical protein [Clostridia bacterium]
MQPLKLGVAYHSNRTFKTVRADLEDIVQHGFNTVIHMYSHNDWVRCPSVMKDIFAATTDLGLDLWVDNWGLMGTPGDPSHFLSYHPEAARMYSDGTRNAPRVCLNSPAFVEWTKEWLDQVYEAGGRKIFWDEPALANLEDKFACGCPLCRSLFEARYHREMPVKPDAETHEFQLWTIVNYLDQVSEYAHSLGMENSVCVMLKGIHGITLDNLDLLGQLKHMDNIGSDPYWSHTGMRDGWEDEEIYKFVYTNALKNMKACEATGKNHNIWVKAYAAHAGFERDVVYAAEAIFDAGARNIFFWGYRGCDGNEYRSHNPEMHWAAVKAATDRLWEKERQRVVSNARKDLGLE